LWLGGTLVGAAAFCVYARTWQSGCHVLYDVPAALAVYSFPARLLAEAAARRFGLAWCVRLAALAAMTVATVGREFGRWPVSGHVTCVLAVAVLMSADARLPAWLRAAYWIPVPVVVLVRVLALEGRADLPLVTGAAAGLVIGAAAAWLARRDTAGKILDAPRAKG
jgi:hypothetical protein